MIKIILVIFLTFYSLRSLADDKILSAPLINLEKLKPSFEETDEATDDTISNEVLKNKKLLPKNNSTSALLIGLDKITAKSSKFVVDLNKVKKYGPLEIKVLKCGKVKVNNKIDSVAYMQVKDLTKNDNDKVFIFNGWTFASDPSLTPFDHAIYDLQLKDCNNV